MRTAERGFTVLEVVVCLGLFAMACAACAGALAATVRNAMPGVTRDLALMIADNALVRARAAVAYAASADGVDVTPQLADRRWALRAGSSASSAGGTIVGPAACAGGGSQLVRFAVTTTFDNATQRIAVSVTYPRDACDPAPAPADLRTVTLSQTLPPSVYAPGQTLVRDIATPARM
jgi:Tfp pilus assembly protein PilV